AALTGAAGHAAAPSTGVQEAAAAAVADPQAPTTQPTDAAPTHRPHEQKGDAR
ncbi:ABC transporter permease, partial [Micrococcus luteus]|nr:ABC transporter permease [Micrococcus luteus]